MTTQPRTPALLVAALFLALALAGCSTQPKGQSVEAPKVDLTLKQVRATCPIEISGAKGIHATMKECAMSLVDGKLVADKITCTGLASNLGSISRNRESTLTLSYYTPGSKQGAATFRYNVEDAKAGKGSCTIDGRVDTFGTYTIRLSATCFKDGHPYLPGVQLAPDGCAQQDDHLKVTKTGGWGR